MGHTRCDCKELGFAGLRAYARRHKITDIEELMARTGCCTGCGTCRPFLEEFLRTGVVTYDGRSFKIPEPEPETPTD